MYVHGFRFYFTPLTGVLFAFPSRYWFTIGQLGVFSLGGWSPHIQSGFLVSRPTRFHYKEVFVYGTITLYRWTFQTILLTSKQLKGCSNFARRYYRNHFCFLFLRVLRCFSSPGLPPCGYYIFNIVGCPIRKSSDQRVCAPPRSLSQLITSFIVSESLGIPHTLLICLLYFFAL